MTLYNPVTNDPRILVSLRCPDVPIGTNSISPLVRLGGLATKNVSFPNNQIR